MAAYQRLDAVHHRSHLVHRGAGERDRLGDQPLDLLPAQPEPLVGRDVDGRIQPWLATDWEVSDDGLTWDLTLAEGITFTDGTALDAEAVKVNIEHLQDPDTASSTGYLAVAKIAEAHDATPAQVIIAWHLAIGNVVFPKSVTPERIQENWDAQKLTLSQDEVEQINGLTRADGRMGPDPADFND